MVSDTEQKLYQPPADIRIMVIRALSSHKLYLLPFIFHCLYSCLKRARKCIRAWCWIEKNLMLQYAHYVLFYNAGERVG